MSHPVPEGVRLPDCPAVGERQFAEGADQCAQQGGLGTHHAHNQAEIPMPNPGLSLRPLDNPRCPPRSGTLLGSPLVYPLKYPFSPNRHVLGLIFPRSWCSWVDVREIVVLRTHCSLTMSRKGRLSDMRRVKSHWSSPVSLRSTPRKSPGNPHFASTLRSPAGFQAFLVFLGG